MYCYELEIVDWFEGLYTLQEYIDKRCKGIDDYHDDVGGSKEDFIAELKGDLNEAIFNLFETNQWERDIRGADNLYIGGLPVGNGVPNTKHYFIFKQDSDGLTFAVSPFHFVHLDSVHLAPVKQIANVNDATVCIETVNKIMAYFNWGK